MRSQFADSAGLNRFDGLRPDYGFYAGVILALAIFVVAFRFGGVDLIKRRNGAPPRERLSENEGMG